MAKNKPLKRWHVYLLAGIVVLSLMYRVYQKFVWPKAVITVHGQSYMVLVANTYQRLYKGLGGKNDLGNYDGMLFLFSSPSRHGIVMRDMRFPLDIIWLDGKRVVDIAPQVQPEPGKPEQELTVYVPSRTSTMVLEMTAGFMERSGLRVGDSIELTFP